MTQNYSIGRHVLDALRDRKPLVALETALVTHGLPRPLNLETALSMEAAVRENGAIPCTIGVLAGKTVIGLSHAELQALSGETGSLKIGLRELPYASAKKKSGGTTVSATAWLARRFGIPVFATGGIGGVHRGARETFDISPDLTVLSQTPVTVVSSGAKAILDLKLTLEYLETACITVAGYQTGYFPAFYSRHSPYRLPLTVETPEEAAELSRARDRLGLNTAVLVCNPVPDKAEISWDELEPMVYDVFTETEAAGIRGQDITPRMLERLFALSGGRTLQANVALLVENAALGARISSAITAGKDV